jgi:hypothetical protein
VKPKPFDGRTKEGKRWLDRKIAIRMALNVMHESADKRGIPMERRGICDTLQDWLIEMAAEEKYQEHARRKGIGHVR